MSVLETSEKDEMLRAEDQALPELGTVIEQRIRSLSVTELVEFLRLEGEDDVVDADEAEAILRVHAITLRKKAVAWGVPHKRLGTEWRFSRRQLLRWMPMQSGIKLPSDTRLSRPQVR